MDLIETLKELLNFVASQASDFIEIVRLKLRIIGFSNKRSGLFTRLGELTYNAIAQNRPVSEDEEIKRLMEEARLAGDEISAAEEAINNKKEESLGARENFRTKWRAEHGGSEKAAPGGEKPGETGDAPTGETSSAASGAVTMSTEGEKESAAGDVAGTDAPPVQ